MPTSCFEKRPNKEIYDTLNSHRPFNMYKMVIDCGLLIDFFIFHRNPSIFTLFKIIYDLWLLTYEGLCADTTFVY